MAVKKTELYSSLWASCDKLRGGMDASQYKDYVLTLLFMKYVTDKYQGQKYADIKVFNKENDPENDPEKRTGCSFDDFIALKGSKNIGEGMDKIIARLAQVNPSLRGIIDNAHFNDEVKIGKGQEMVDKLTDLISIFQRPELNFKKNRAEGDDIIGDAYEYLMKNFASQSGKSKGQFYTPAEVSRILAMVIGIDKCTDRNAEICDPACGSGSLLVRALNEAPFDIAGYGQEKDTTTAGLAKMNAVLHNKATIVIKAGNTFSDPQYKKENNDNELKRFDYIVANPPFSTKNWTAGLQDYGRFNAYGERPPETNGDYAWLLHILKTLKSNGKAAVILPHGVLFRGNAEGVIRKSIIDKGYIKGIISLPANLFFGTGIPACVIVIDKENAENRNGIFMIDASRDFIKNGNKNKLRERDIYKIVTTFNQQLTDDPKYARFVPNLEIKVKNDYNLNITRYIDSGEQVDMQNIQAHIHGGIPDADIEDLHKYWTTFPSLKGELISAFNDGFHKLNIPRDNIRETIFANNEFAKYGEKVEATFVDWKTYADTLLTTISSKTRGKNLIFDLGEKILEVYSTLHLIDKYDAYQVLLEYWNEILGDDVSLIISDGYSVARETEIIMGEYTSGKKKGQEKVIGWEGKLIPKSIMIDALFQEDKIAIQEAERILAETESHFDEFIEENNGDEGILSNYSGENDKIDTKAIEARVKVLKKIKSDTEEYQVLTKYVTFSNKIKKDRKAIKLLKDVLDEKCKNRYSLLTDEEIMELLINRKWYSSIRNGLEELYSDVSHTLADRLIELAERYNQTLQEILDEVFDNEEKVRKHLERMGFAWQS